jgi:hypothetical protein
MTAITAMETVLAFLVMANQIASVRLMPQHLSRRPAQVSAPKV